MDNAAVQSHLNRRNTLKKTEYCVFRGCLAGLASVSLLRKPVRDRYGTVVARLPYWDYAGADIATDPKNTAEYDVGRAAGLLGP